MSSPHKIVYAAYMLLKAKDDQGLSRPDRFHVKRAQLDYEGSGLSYGTPGEAISFYNKHRKANKPPNNFEVSRIQDLFREWSRSQNDALPIPDQPSLRVYWQQLHDYSKGDRAPQRSDLSESQAVGLGSVLEDAGTSNSEQPRTNGRKRRGDESYDTANTSEGSARQLEAESKRDQLALQLTQLQKRHSAEKLKNKQLVKVNKQLRRELDCATQEVAAAKEPPGFTEHIARHTYNHNLPVKGKTEQPLGGISRHKRRHPDLELAADVIEFKSMEDDKGMLAAGAQVLRYSTYGSGKRPSIMPFFEKHPDNLTRDDGLNLEEYTEYANKLGVTVDYANLICITVPYDADKRVACNNIHMYQVRFDPSTKEFYRTPKEYVLPTEWGDYADRMY